MPSTDAIALVDLMHAALLRKRVQGLAPHVGNTGDGILFDPENTDAAIIGGYVITLTDATHFDVAAPGGAHVGAGVIGARFGGGGIAFSSKAGAVAFVAGDSFQLGIGLPTVVGDAVFVPRDWPATTDKYPMLKLGSPRETKTGKGPNGPQFDTVVTVRVIGTLAVKAQKKDAGAGVALAAIGALKRQCELAIINDYDLFRVIQEMESVDIETKVSNEGEEHLAEVTMDFSMKFPQGPEDFAPPALSTISELDIFVDVVNRADPTGVYVPPMDYTPTAPPRTRGPDGRIEGGLVLKTEG